MTLKNDQIMKKIILSLGFLIAMASFSGAEAANINVNVNIGVQPAWGPVGYNYVSFYYFPDINVYYNVNKGVFHYPHGGRWVSARYLPGAYRNYDLYYLYKVVLTDNNPWRYNRRHMHDYRHYKGNRSQIVIRNSHDNRYRDSRRNDVRWYDDKHRGNDNRGRDRDLNRDRDNGRHRDYGRSTADRQRDSDRGNRVTTNQREDKKRSDRSNSRNDARYVEVSTSKNTDRSRDRKSDDRSKDRSSSRSDSRRSSSDRR